MLFFFSQLLLFFDNVKIKETIWTYHYPKRWRLTVQRTKDEGNHEKQIYVTEECYDAVNVGDWFIYDKSFCSFTEPCEKSKEGEKQ